MSSCTGFEKSNKMALSDLNKTPGEQEEMPEVASQMTSNESIGLHMKLNSDSQAGSGTKGGSTGELSALEVHRA